MTQIYNINHGDDVNRRKAEEQVEKKFKKPLYGYAFPPRADVCFEGKWWLILCQSVDWMAQRSSLWADLHIPESGKHGDQVKVLIEKTASSLDDNALKMLFVSVQQNNIELCVLYAINLYVMFLYCWWDLILAFSAWLNRSGSIIPFVLITIKNDCVRLNVIQEFVTWCTMTWFGHSYVGEHSIYWTGYSLFTK